MTPHVTTEVYQLFTNGTETEHATYDVAVAYMNQQAAAASAAGLSQPVFILYRKVITKSLVNIYGGASGAQTIPPNLQSGLVLDSLNIAYTRYQAKQ